MRTIRYYGYDANGERVYKLTGESSIDFLGQGIADATVQFDDAVLYPNPYLTVTSQGYTKHYYANGERLASVIGHGGWDFMVQNPIELPTSEEKEKRQMITNMYDAPYPLDHKDVYSITDHNEDIEGSEKEYLQYDCKCNQVSAISATWKPDILYLTMDANTHPNGYPEDEIYYTHSDHLGSSAWITDSYADPIQYLHYLPYGELLANKQSTTYDERYKFIGKERDWESGYDYFGARYYISPFLHWMSVDPLSDNNLEVSPYAYCSWNPIHNIDSWGQSTRVAAQEDGTYQVLGGSITDNDRNIYVYSKDDKGEYSIRGESIGISTSLTSFYDTDCNTWDGKIDMSDRSGDEFLNNIYCISGELFSEYIPNAREGDPIGISSLSRGYKILTVVADGITYSKVFLKR